MLLSQINNLFQRRIKLNDFKERITEEVSDYKKSLHKKGNSSPVFLNEDCENILITQADIQLLCEAFLRNNLNKWELNYVAEALLLSQKVQLENDRIENALLALSDPEYYNLISADFVKKILQEL